MKRILLLLLIVLDIGSLGLFIYYRTRSHETTGADEEPVLPATVQAFYFVSPNGNDNNRGNLRHPFATLTKARDVVRSINKNMTGDIIINLRDGSYQPETPLTLTSEDKGTNGFNIIYKAYKCEAPTISGGRKISGWALYDVAKNIYKASINSSSDSRQLYVNGLRAIRARSIDATGWSENGDGYDCPAAVAGWKNITNVEVVSFHKWKCHRGPIANVSGNHAVMAQPYWAQVHRQEEAEPVWVENAYELLDEEGEWYLDRPAAKIYYKPRAGEVMATAEVILPKLESLINASGASHILFHGLNFAYTTWLYPNTVNGFSCAQSEVVFGSPADVQLPGALNFDHCENIRFENNSFEHLGIGGLHLYSGCKTNTVYDNVFRDISGTAISIGSYGDNNPSAADLVKDNTIDNNLISNVANEYLGCVGIFTGYTDHVVLTHNEIRNLPYTGISMGWGWSNIPTVAKNNEVSYNRIDSVMTTLIDGGAIYTLSAQAGSNVNNNYVNHQINLYGSLYPDEGSSDMHWHHNVVQNSPMWLHIWTPSIQNIRVDYNYYDNPTQTVNGTACIIENNVHVTGGAWPAEASDIMAQSGRKGVSGLRIQVKGVCVSPVELTLDNGSSAQLKASISPGNADIRNVSWQSGDDAIATVDANGLVTAKAKGSTIITARTLDQNKTAECMVTVRSLFSRWEIVFGITFIVISLLIGLLYYRRH